jgi:hypothetical protein
VDGVELAQRPHAVCEYGSEPSVSIKGKEIRD